jgi:hypothetical protein
MKFNIIAGTEVFPTPEMASQQLILYQQQLF